MNRFLFLFTALGIQAAICPATSGAGANANAKVVLHLTAPVAKNACTRAEAAPPCDGVVTAGDLRPASYFAYVLVMDGSAPVGIAGVQFGIDYDGAPASGVDVFSWTLCGVLEFPQPLPAWPGAGGGNLLTWGPCQTYEPGGPGTGVTAVAGYFYVSAYAYDVMTITPRPVDGLAKVADCSSREDILFPSERSPLGQASFSSGASTPGYNPCGAVSNFSCAITGPFHVNSGALQSYSVSSPGPGTLIEWSVTGDATVVGPNDGTVVQVEAGGGPDFRITVRILYAGLTRACSRTITIIPAVNCQISGSAAVITGSAGNSYSVTNSLNPATFSWSIAGDGTIDGATTGSSVSVRAGSVGSFTLDVTVMAGGEIGQCSKTVSVIPEPLSCSISGSPIVEQGSSGNVYSVSTSSPLPVFTWSISGNGAIVGSTTGSFVSVSAGAAGSFRLAVDFTSGGEEGRCTRDVIVTEGACSVFGPDSVTELIQADFSTPTIPGVSYRWSVEGNGFLNGPANGSTVHVLPSLLGWMTVKLNRSTGAGSDSCSRSVRINRNPAVSFNGDAELLVHLTSPVDQNPCGRMEARPTCEDAVVAGSTAPARYFAYILLTGGFGDGGELGIGGLNVKIRYDPVAGQGVDILSWSPCGVTESPDPGWPQSRTGNRLLWNECQRHEPGGPGSGITATPGYFYLAAYTPDLLIMDEGSSVFDCAGVTDEILYLGFAGFDLPGGAPCDHPQPLPVMNTTWGAIKALYAR